MSDLALRQPEALLIGIDQSYTGFGLVVLDDTGNCLKKLLLKYPSNKYVDEGKRLIKIYLDLLAVFIDIQNQGIKVKVGMEGYSYGSKLNREKLGELGGIVKLAANVVFNCTPEIIAPTALKKYVTGSGKADKRSMLLSIQRLDPEIKDHNLADAYGIAYFLWKQH